MPLYRAADKAGKTIDFLFKAKRDQVAARCFFEKSIAQNGVPETITIDKSGSNVAALHAMNAKPETPITVRQVKYLNSVIEQDHRAINAAPDRCWDSRGFVAPTSSCPAWK
jgi:putative transposase